MSLREKLQLQEPVRVMAAPDDVDLGDVEQDDGADGLLLFTMDRVALGNTGLVAWQTARRGSTTWIAYPKAGQLNTDLNRDTLATIIQSHGLKPVRQVAIDDVWSALRIRDN